MSYPKALTRQPGRVRSYSPDSIHRAGKTCLAAMGLCGGEAVQVRALISLTPAPITSMQAKPAQQTGLSCCSSPLSGGARHW